MSEQQLPTVRMRQGEMDELFAMFAVLQEMDKCKTDMRQRLKAIPNGLRDLRLVETTLMRLLQNMLKTVPTEKLLSIRRMLPNMKYKVYYYGNMGAKENNETAIDVRMLHQMCVLIHDYYCLCCEHDCDRCKYGIGKIFDNIFKEDRETSWADCDFIDDGGDAK